MVATNNSANVANTVWKPSDVSTFTQQAQNLGQQAQTAGINNTQQDVQAQTGLAQVKAGQSGQNVAAGATQVSSGAQVTPAAAQAPLNVSGGSSPTIQPYQATTAAPATPSTTITTPTSIPVTDSTYNPNVSSYLGSLFPQGIPQAVLDSINQSLGNDVSGSYTAVTGNAIGGVQPFQNDAQQAAYTTPTTAPQISVNPAAPPTMADKIQLPDFSNVGNSASTQPDSSLSTDFTNYLNSLQAGQNSAVLSPDVQAQFQTWLQDQLATGQQNLNSQYQTTQNGLATENTNLQQGVSNYIDNLNTNLQNYTNTNQDLSNVGQQSAAEQQSAANNAILAGQGALSGPTAGTEALGAATNNNGLNSRFGVLSQQAQSGALQNAQSNAVQAQNIANIGQNQLTSGQTAQSNALTQAGTDISTNQTNLLNQLSNNSTAAQQALTTAYNTAGTNLSTQEQSYVNAAQNTLQQANVPESAIQTAVSAFSNTIQNSLSNNTLDAQGKSTLLTNLESIWRIAVGTNPSDIDFSNTIAGILNPIIQQVNGISVPTPTAASAPAPTSTTLATTPVTSKENPGQGGSVPVPNIPYPKDRR